MVEVCRFRVLPSQSQERRPFVRNAIGLGPLLDGVEGLVSSALPVSGAGPTRAIVPNVPVRTT